MKVFLASDHAGFELKEKIGQWLKEWGYDFEDLGAFTYDAEDDYPVLIEPAAEAVAKDPENHRAIVLGGSGQGEAMTCNIRVPEGIRAGVYYGGKSEIVRLLRDHNNANILSLGARFVTEEEAKEAIEIFLVTPFSVAERHKRRIEQLTKLSL